MVETCRDTPKRKVLFVDDECVIADSLAQIFRRVGYETRAVYSGEAAIALLGEFEPDVVVSDVMMREVDGVEVAIFYKNRRPACRTILLSGQAATEDLLKSARQQGHRFDIHAKPIAPGFLIAAVNREFEKDDQVMLGVSA